MPAQTVESCSLVTTAAITLPQLQQSNACEPVLCVCDVAAGGTWVPCFGEARITGVLMDRPSVTAVLLCSTQHRYHLGST